jgi:hypothetical protein
MTFDVTIFNVAHPRTALVVGRRCRDAQTAAKMSEAMFLLVRSLMPLRSPTLRSWQSSSFALPESGTVCGCVHFNAFATGAIRVSSFAFVWFVFFAVHHPAVSKLMG